MVKKPHFKQAYKRTAITKLLIYALSQLEENGSINQVMNFESRDLYFWGWLLDLGWAMEEHQLEIRVKDTLRAKNVHAISL